MCPVRSDKKDATHEGLIVTDGRNTFRIVNGVRAWESTPPQPLRDELLIEAHRLRLSRAMRAESSPANL
jgi:hypothetical protein